MQNRIIRAEFPDIPGAFLFLSGHKKKAKEPLEQLNTETCVSFVFISEEKATEWEPKYGPIQVWKKADGSDESHKPHYIFEFVQDTPGNWSQLAVAREGLPEAFLCGDYKYIFQVLREWAHA